MTIRFSRWTLLCEVSLLVISCTDINKKVYVKTDNEKVCNVCKNVAEDYKKETTSAAEIIIIIIIIITTTTTTTIISDVEKTESWKNEIIHRKHPYQLSLEYVDKEASNMWLWATVCRNRRFCNCNTVSGY
jgi:hypothetical protein